jgi:hypothetical protein
VVLGFLAHLDDVVAVLPCVEERVTVEPAAAGDPINAVYISTR